MAGALTLVGDAGLGRLGARPRRVQFGLHKLLGDDDGVDAGAGEAQRPLSERATALTIPPPHAELALLDRDLVRALDGVSMEDTATASGADAASVPAAASQPASGAGSIYVFNGEDYTDRMREHRAAQDQDALDRVLAQARLTNPALANARRPPKVRSADATLRVVRGVGQTAPNGYVYGTDRLMTEFSTDGWARTRVRF